MNFFYHFLDMNKSKKMKQNLYEIILSHCFNLISLCWTLVNHWLNFMLSNYVRQRDAKKYCPIPNFTQVAFRVGWVLRVFGWKLKVF